MVAKILGAQRDFSFGEVDATLKRSDDHPARKAGLRQMSNARILNSGSLQDRPGRTALFPTTAGCTRTEEITMSSGNVFKIAFGPSRIEIRNAANAVVASFTAQITTAPFPWATAADIQKIVYTVVRQSICVTFLGAMRPQLVSWDGVSTWSLAPYTELLAGNQKRTWFYRIAPQGITIQPSALTGAITITASAAVFTPQHVGARIRYINRQIIITTYVSPTQALGVVQETLNGSQTLQFATTPVNNFSIGDVVIGSLTGSKGIITFINGPGDGIVVQLLTSTTVSSVSVPGASFSPGSSGASTVQTFAFLTNESAVGPANAMVITNVGPVFTPQPCAIWDEEVMNDLRGYPGSCFSDQFRLGFCDFPSVPNGIAWSAINSPSDMYVGPNPSDAMFEIAPAKVRIFHVVPGPESSEFVFTDRRVYYIPISPTNPLKPGSVQFLTLSGDGSAQVQPRLAQEAVLYCNAGQNSVMAIIATGAYLRPFNTKNLCEFHSHLFNAIQCIAAPSADGTFNERYAYVLNGDGSIAVGKYNADSLAGNAPVIGWGPWSGTGVVSWIAAFAADVLFTSTYFGTGICEILDDSQYVDCALPVNSASTPFTPPGGKGPLWFIPSQTVTLLDQVTRAMGTYQIDANGFIVAQFNGGENLSIASLVAGQPWTTTIEPFCPDAAPGNDVGQRMFKRRIARFAVYVMHSTGFLMARLFAGPTTRTSPALGTVMNQRRVTTWNQDDDPTLPPPQREEAQRWRPLGRAYDPRVAIIKDTPGPLQILELGIEATI